MTAQRSSPINPTVIALPDLAGNIRREPPSIKDWTEAETTVRVPAGSNAAGTMNRHVRSASDRESPNVPDTPKIEPRGISHGAGEDAGFSPRPANPRRSRRRARASRLWTVPSGSFKWRAASR
jgi:hypothetical protein